MSERPSPPHRRHFLWIGLALIVAAPLLGEETLLRVLGGSALRPSLATQLGAALMQWLVFSAGIAALRARRGAEGGLLPGRQLVGSAAAWLGALVTGRAFEAATGVAEILCAGAAIGLGIFALRGAAELLLAALGFRKRVPAVTGPLIAVAAVTLAAAVLEALLGALALLPSTAGKGAPQRLAMPEALQRREVKVPGAREAYWWQGQLHVLDADHLRRTTPLPPKAAGTFRIAAFGDSLTYGEGVAAEEAWPAVLEKTLQGDYRAEVLNLGVKGAQSEDILKRAERLLPVLEPDLVLYGVCLNDFLPAGRLEYRNNRAWSFTLPHGFHLEHGTRLGALVVSAYDKLLMRAGVRTDFYTDILRDFGSYQQRFARDVAALNRLVTARGLPPVVGMVLNQYPALEGPGWRIGRLAEELMRAGGLAVVPADYIRAHAGRDLSVSPWEGHPSAEAHRIFAAAFLASIQRDPRLGSHFRDAPTAAPPAR